MSSIKKLFPPPLKSALLPGLIFTLVVILTLFVFEAYVLIVNHFNGKLPLPSNFGNHPHVIKMLTDQGKKDTFRFAVIGDTKSEGTLYVDYVFGGDFHGYARTRFGYPTYLITGGGGGNLEGDSQFHHAVVVTVGKNLISERIIKVDKSVYVADVLERRAIGDVYPWLLENRVWVLRANAGLLVILLGTIFALRKHLKVVKLLHRFRG